jgi:hypothetical protein
MIKCVPNPALLRGLLIQIVKPVSVMKGEDASYKENAENGKAGERKFRSGYQSRGGISYVACLWRCRTARPVAGWVFRAASRRPLFAWGSLPLWIRSSLMWYWWRDWEGVSLSLSGCEGVLWLIDGDHVHERPVEYIILKPKSTRIRPVRCDHSIL